MGEGILGGSPRIYTISIRFHSILSQTSLFGETVKAASSRLRMKESGKMPLLHFLPREIEPWAAGQIFDALALQACCFTECVQGIGLGDARL